MLNGWKKAKKLLTEVNRLKIENTKLSKENYEYSKSKVFKCDYNNLLHENKVLSSRRILDFEYIQTLELEKEEYNNIKERYINLLASFKINNNPLH